METHIPTTYYSYIIDKVLAGLTAAQWTKGADGRISVACSLRTSMPTIKLKLGDKTTTNWWFESPPVDYVIE